MKTEQTLSTEVVTANSEQLAVLKSNFPQCFDRQGKFILSKLQDILQANAVDVSRESYSLNWLGKSYARVLANEPIRTMLSEDHEHNQLEHNKNSHNLLIQGDNLEVLKHLKGAYTDKIKMIYIDPPYNTGSDGFVYKDDRSFSPEQFAELAGIDLDEAKRVLDFTQSNANSHSAWLTFIYPRLYIAKQLLKEDGVIFISIDDNEQAQLKILCDEIFGEANFVANIPTIMNLKGNHDNYGFSDTHEYCLVYVLDKTKMVFGEFAVDDDSIDSEWQEDEYGFFKRADTLRRTGQDASREKRPKGFFPVFYNQKTNSFYVTDNDLPKDKDDLKLLPINDDGEELSWSWSKKTITEYNYDLILVEGRNFKNIYKKQRPRLGDLPTKKPKTVFYKPEYSTSTATTYLKNLLNKKVFEGTKPVPFIRDLIRIGCNKDSYVLDFFGGSGTTAEAVLTLNNLEEDRNHKYIIVQLDEKTDPNKDAYKAGYKTIFEITKDRIIKASEKLAHDHPDTNVELGFKIFKTCENFLPSSIYKELKQLTLSQSATPSSTAGFDEAQLQDILNTWKGLDKILLSENPNSVNLGDYPAYSFGHVLYLVHQGFNTTALKELIKKLDDEHEFQVSKLVLLGHHFDSKSQREINEAMKNYNNKKSIPVDVVVRY
ncbi:site-specific DNA-methyltransferase [Acinetobacter sp. ANC 5600]|uniref:site-specific DNA-methyltransferase n=1 Tax=Acinetobacter sp. ANC 5600 TaxID=1960940 RepID=UPI0009947635|nr:site-specific DNA-methyltransferase [Acinetobacter sp. ANC 5600]OOV83759.1 restriction endonuclease subunit M [Acinetobacter sp. ANC 5600]